MFLLQYETLCGSECKYFLFIIESSYLVKTLHIVQAGDIYRAGRMYGLMPIMAEVYNLGEPAYYAVAVVKIR